MLKGQPTEIGMKVNPEYKFIKVNMRKINCQNFLSKLPFIYKFRYLETSFDSNHNTKIILDNLPQKYKKGFYPIESLDYYGRSLKFFTNNRKLSYELSYQMFCYKKNFVLKTNYKVDQNLIEKLQVGINLYWKRNHPYKNKILKDDIKFPIFKKRINRQIKKVANFKKTEFESFFLDGLKDGDRKLIKALKFEDIK